MINNSKAIWSDITIYKVKDIGAYIQAPSEDKINHLEKIRTVPNCRKIKKVKEVNPCQRRFLDFTELEVITGTCQYHATCPFQGMSNCPLEKDLAELDTMLNELKGEK